MDFRLNNGVLMPAMGLGTYGIKGDNVAFVLERAFKVGYRLIDTAAVYHNESEIGQAIKSLGIDRNNIFITTKLSARDHGREASTAALNKSLQNLGTDYIDLYLIHWPGVKGYKHGDPKHGQLRRDTWLQLEKFYAEGIVKAIGVSNYTVNHLKELLTYCTVKPAVNQVEYHPHLVQRELLQFCQQYDIHLQSFSTLGSGTTHAVRTDEVASALADKYGATPPQVILKWAIQQGIGVIPKSTNPAHILSNFEAQSLLRLSDEDVQLLSSRNRNLRYCNLNPELIL